MSIHQARSRDPVSHARADRGRPGGRGDSGRPDGGYRRDDSGFTSASVWRLGRGTKPALAIPTVTPTAIGQAVRPPAPGPREPERLPAATVTAPAPQRGDPGSGTPASRQLAAMAATLTTGPAGAARGRDPATAAGEAHRTGATRAAATAVAMVTARTPPDAAPPRQRPPAGMLRPRRRAGRELARWRPLACAGLARGGSGERFSSSSQSPWSASSARSSSAMTLAS